MLTSLGGAQKFLLERLLALFTRGHRLRKIFFPSALIDALRRHLRFILLCMLAKFSHESFLTEYQIIKRVHSQKCTLVHQTDKSTHPITQCPHHESTV